MNAGDLAKVGEVVTDHNIREMETASMTDEQIGTLAAFQEKLNAAQTGSPTVEPALPADYLIYVDHVDGEEKITTVQDMLESAMLSGYINGTGSGISTTSTATALAIFDTGFFTSTVTGIAKSADDTGLTLNVPVRYEVMCTVSMAAGTNTDFTFQLYVGGVAIGREVHASGDGNGKDTNFTARGFTTTAITPPAKVELRVSNNGDTITTISADMTAEYAG